MVLTESDGLSQKNAATKMHFYSRVMVCKQLTGREESYKDIGEDRATEKTRRTSPNRLLDIAAAKRD